MVHTLHQDSPLAELLVVWNILVQCMGTEECSSHLSLLHSEGRHLPNNMYKINYCAVLICNSS